MNNQTDTTKDFSLLYIARKVSAKSFKVAAVTPDKTEYLLIGNKDCCGFKLAKNDSVAAPVYFSAEMANTLTSHLNDNKDSELPDIEYLGKVLAHMFGESIKFSTNLFKNPTNGKKPSGIPLVFQGDLYTMIGNTGYPKFIKGEANPRSSHPTAFGEFHAEHIANHLNEARFTTLPTPADISSAMGMARESRRQELQMQQERV